MRLGYTINYTDGFTRAADQCIQLESAGLDVVWVAEAYGFDAPSHMGYLAAVTSSMEIGSGILQLYTRTPTLMAMTAAGVDSVSGGRCILGIGASGPQVIEGFHGVPYQRPVGRTRETIDVCRKVWRREVLRHQGRDYQIPLPDGHGTGLGKPLKMITHPVRQEIPIFVAALGEKNVEMAAELADGWLPILFYPEKAASVWGASLAAGYLLRGERGPLRISAGGMIGVVGSDAERDAILDLARPMVALYVGGMGARGKNFYNSLMRRYGYEEEAEEIQRLYLEGRKAEAAAAVPHEFLLHTHLVGDEPFVRSRLEAWAAAGVTDLNVMPVGGDPVRVVEQVKGWAAAL